MTAEQRNAEEIRRDVEQTREEFGDTVEALAAKADVAGRARDKRDEVKEAAQAKVKAAGQTAQAKAVAAKEATQAKAAEMSERVRTASPEDARRAVLQVREQARRHPRPLAAIGAATLLLVAWRVAARRRSGR